MWHYIHGNRRARLWVVGCVQNGRFVEVEVAVAKIYAGLGLPSGEGTSSGLSCEPAMC